MEGFFRGSGDRWEGLLRVWFLLYWSRCNSTIDMSHIVNLKHKFENGYTLNGLQKKKGLCKGKIVVLHLLLSFVF